MLGRCAAASARALATNTSGRLPNAMAVTSISFSGSGSIDSAIAEPAAQDAERRKMKLRMWSRQDKMPPSFTEPLGALKRLNHGAIGGKAMPNLSTVNLAKEP